MFGVQQPAQAAGGFGAFNFGSQPAAGAAAPAAGGGLFGQQPAAGAAAPAAGAFGAGFGSLGQQQAAPAAGGGLFGQQPAAGTAAPAAGAFGAGFGSLGQQQAAPAAGGGLFGQQPAAGAAAPAAGAFGAGFGSLGQQPGAAAPAAGAFGTGFGGFGQTAAPATGFGAFGALGQQAAGGAKPAFGGFAAGGGAFGQPFGLGLPIDDKADQLPKRPEQYEHGDKIDDIQRSYAPVLDALTQQPLPAAITGRSAFINEKSCKFDAIFYDLKQSSSAGAPRQPINSGQRWEQAECDNPDPENLEPVRELGIAGLKKRFDNQSTLYTKLRSQVTECGGLLEKTEKETRRTSSKVEALKAKQGQLYNRMLSVVRSVEVLRCRGVPISSAERKYRERLEHLLSDMYQPHAKLQELLILQSQQCRPNDVYSDTIAEEDVEAMCRLLKQQRDGLQHLTDILTKDARDIALVKRELSAAHYSPYY